MVRGMQLKPVTALPSRSGSPGPSNYDQIVSLTVRLAPILAGIEPAQYRTADIEAALAADPVGSLGVALPPATESVVNALRYLGHDTPKIDGAPSWEFVAIQSPSELTWRRQQVLAAVPRAAVASTSLEGRGYLPPGREGQVLTVRALQRRLRARWVTSWGLRGHVDRFTDEGVLVPVSAQRPATVWQVPA